MMNKSYIYSSLGMRFLPVVVWLATVAVVIGLFTQRARRFEVLGIAQGQLYQVAATVPGRLKDVPVVLFDKVKKGQTIAVIDIVLDNESRPEVVKAQLATIQAEIEHLMAQLAATKDTLLADKSDREINHIADSRRFAVDMENTRLEILRLRALIASDRITLEDLAVEIKIVQHLVQQQAIGPYELEKVKVQYSMLAEKIKENEQLLEQAQKNLQEASHRQDEYAKLQLYYPSVDNALDVIRKAIIVQERTMEELTVRPEPLELKAPFDGVVSQILHRTGEAVLEGVAILTITEEKPSEIIAYVREDQVNQIQEGMKVELIKSSEPAQIVQSRVIYVGPAVEQMPMRWLRNPNIPQWGRPFRVEAPAQMKLTIGERVGIRRV